MAKSKAAQQVLHLKKRLMQRYGVELTEALYYRWQHIIKKGKARLVEKQSNRVSLFEVPLPINRVSMSADHSGNEDLLRSVRVVYDNVRKTIVTILPEETK